MNNKMRCADRANPQSKQETDQPANTIRPSKTNNTTIPNKAGKTGKGQKNNTNNTNCGPTTKAT